MNAVTPFPPTHLPREPFDRALNEVNEWRGRCLDSFTRGEAAVTECLRALAATPGRGIGITLPHLLGERLETLAAAVGTDGPFVLECPHVAPALARFRKHAPFRNMLCHAVTDITLDQKGRWTVVLRLGALRSGRLVKDALPINQDEAGPLADEVMRDTRNLRARLKKLASGLAAERVAVA